MHTQKGRFFSPENSKNGVGMWKREGNVNDMNYIAENLKKFCKDY